MRRRTAAGRVRAMPDQTAHATSSSDPGPRTRRSSPGAAPYLWALGLLWGVPALLVLVGSATLPEDNASGQCEGIGFGCVPSPADTVVLLGMLAAPVLVAAGVIAVLAIAGVRALRSRGQS